ncbi:MAG: CHAT domain-containing protein, partial [Chitinophagaceae bacterium]
FDQVKPGANETFLLKASLDEMKSYKKVHYLASLVMDKGDAYLQQYKQNGNALQLMHAIGTYKIADALLNRIKAEQSETSSKLFWRNDTRRLYEHAIEACLLQNNTSDAFYFFEKSRATLLNDQLIAQHWLAAEDITRMIQMRKKLSEIDHASEAAASNPDEYARLSVQRSQIINDIYSLEGLVKKRNPLYYSNMIDTNAVSLHSVQQMLMKERQVLLELFAGDSAVYSLLVTPAGVQLKKIDKRLYNTLTTAFLYYTSDAGRLNSNFTAYRKTAHELYNLLFQGMPVSKGRIIISPDGSYFPFEALITDNTLEKPVYFVKDYAVSYTYSAGYLQNSFSSDSTHSEKFLLGVAPVRYASRLNLPPLEGSDASLKKIHRFYGGYLDLVGEKASREKFLSSFSEYSVVQFYTHASDSSADSSGHNEPVIYFADAPLYLSELMPQERSVTRLIVLSACESAGGRVYQGEGVFSFNRGFAALGIPSSITNLWAVENRSTYRLTELFYKYMAEGHSLDVALQMAKLEFIDNTADREALPYYWSAAIMMGKTDPIVYPKRSNMKWLFLAVLAIPAFVVLRRYRKKN